MAHSVIRPILKYISKMRKANEIRKLKPKIRAEIRHAVA